MFIRSGLGTAVVFLAIIVILGGVGVVTTWGDGNAKYLASYPQIQLSDKAYPETDPDHIVIVPLEVATYKGGQIVGGGGGNLGSIYHPGTYTLQSVQSHMYWVAPLVYNNFFSNLSNYTSPGVVVVDAEDPNAPGMLKLDHKLHYLPDAVFGQDLVRYLYTHGYSNFKLIDPTLEMDDNWVPHFTTDISTYVTGATGNKVIGVLVVNSDTGEIQPYTMNEVPAWIDRIIPGKTAQEYVEWWGLFASAPWFNASGQGQQKPADTDPTLAYSRADQSPVWQFPMTSSSSKDKSATGIVLFDTKANTATLYPVNGIAVGEDVIHAFQSNPKNIKNYAVKHVVLHSIYGELTWVATFISISEGSDGKGSFQGVGLLNAKTIQGADVIMGTSKEEALRDYKHWIANHGSNTVNPTDVNNTVVIDGIVDRFSADAQGGNSVYILTIKTMDGALVDRIFWGTSMVSQKLPLTQTGDHVAIKYQDTNERVVEMVEFNNFNIEVPLINPETGEGYTGQATLAPTLTPTPIPTPTPDPLFEATPSQ